MSSRTHQLYHDLQKERIKVAALRLELHRARQDKDALKLLLDAAYAELDAITADKAEIKSDLCLMQHVDMTSAQYEALCLMRVEKGWPGDPPQRPFLQHK